jgi:2-hydroxychromene-2-carboxylate isomerase
VFRCEREDEVFRAEIARRARKLGLQPLRWPQPYPFNSDMAMRVATYARSIGRGVAFAQAAFRQAFAGGRSLELPDNVLIAAAACEMHPQAVLVAAARDRVADELAHATELAGSEGVRSTPAIRVVRAHGVELFEGERVVEEAAAAISPREGA